MRCWWCGAQPDGLYRVQSMETAEEVLVVDWPAVIDHEHAAEPPTADQLAVAGHEALIRIREVWR